jgi:hypothetical protein
MANEEQIDEYAKGVFMAMGFDAIPDGLLMTYREMKLRLDRIQPGRRLSPEGFVFVTMLFDLGQAQAEKSE